MGHSHGSKSRKRKLYREQNGLCAICGELMVHPQQRDFKNPNLGTIDHIIPRCQGGLTERSNLQLVHLRCNQRKGGIVMGTALGEEREERLILPTPIE
jgi:5-methylcytosine-specific restriction endonuclease McrA